MGRGQTGGKVSTDYILGKEHKLNSSQVATIVRHVHQHWKGVGKPTIDVDASIYMYRFCQTKKEPVEELAAFLIAWASVGIDVTCVLDPLCGVRDDTKRAAIKRSGERMSNKFKAFEAKAQLLRLGQQLQNTTSQPDGFDPAKTKLEMLQYEKIIKSADSSMATSTVLMSNRLPELLSEALQSLGRPPRCGDIRILIAKTQADSAISYRMLNGHSQAVLSSDMDYGHLCTARCIQVDCSFSGRRKKDVDSIKDIIVSSTSKSAIDVVIKALSFPPTTEIKTPRYPLFNGRSPWWCAIIAVAIGCDQCPGGVTDVNVSVISKWLHRFPNGTDSDFLDFLVNPPLNWTPRREKPTLSIEYLIASAQAIYFEPGDLLSYTDDTGDVLVHGDDTERLYLHRAPHAAELFAYCKAFSCNNTIIHDGGPSTTICCGQKVDACASHVFLTEEGVVICEACQESFCRFCVQTDFNNIQYCFSCYSQRLVTRGIPIVDGPSHPEMLAYLVKECNQQDMEKASVLEVSEMYDAVVQKRILLSPEPSKLVKYPLLCTEDIIKLGVLCTFDMAEGGRFMRDENLSDKQRIELLVLFSKLVRFGGSSCDHRGSDKAVYSAVSDILVNWAENSRYDTGYRLLERACRHAHDTKGPELCQATGAVVDYQGKTCLKIDATIRASMKDQVYRTCIVISDCDLVACGCTCPAGSCGVERHVDVHVAALVQKLSLFLFDGLGEHLLIEMAAQWHLDQPELSSSQKWELFEAMGLLKLCGREATEVEAINTNASIKEFLSSFDVLTNKTKEWRAPSLPKKGDKPQGPLREDLFLSPGKSNANFITRVKKESLLLPASASDSATEVINNQCDIIPVRSTMNATSGPDYITTMHSIVALCGLMKNVQEHIDINAIGISLLRVRYEKTRNKTGLCDRSVNLLTKSLSNLIEEAVEVSKRRSRLINSASSNEDTFAINETSPESDDIYNVENMRPTKKARLDDKPRKGYGNKCSIAFCCNNSNNYSGLFRRVPLGSINLAATWMDKERLKTIAIQNFIRSEFFERMGHGRTGKNLTVKDPMRSGLRYCCCHEMEVVTKYVTYKWYPKTKKRKSDVVTDQERITFEVIKGLGRKSFSRPAVTENKGIGFDRDIARRVDEAFGKEHDSWKLVLQQHVELTDDSACSNPPINERVSRLAGFPARTGLDKPRQKRQRYQREAFPKKRMPWNCEPAVVFALDAATVKKDTGFANMLMLLRFVLVVCNGDIEVVTNRATSITWLEEWFLYFEWTWGRSVQRLVDIESKYTICEKTARTIIRQKRKVVLHARLCWPFFATYEEDVTLRAEKWKNRYPGKRIVFWDDTNINIPAPRDASLNRRTYSSYYNGNVGKGGVSIQLCGWISTWNLWTGAVSDSYYLSNSGILEMQEEFAANDESSNEPFTNVTDKGYRCNVAAWQKGKQSILQPTFAKSDQQFTTNQLLSSAAIATDRGGNERAVNVCKQSGLLKRGLQQNGTMEDLDDAWLAWSFQANFMYNSVL